MSNKALEIKNLSFKYRHNSKETLKKINLSVEKGKWLSILGRNGSGKTTLIKLAAGLLENSSKGSIKIFDQEVNQANFASIKEHIGMVFQNPDNQFVGPTVQDDVAFGLENKSIERNEMIERVDSALKDVEMIEFANREPNSLSGGQKQRVALASVLALQPDIIILDEATSMLDPKGRKSLLKLVQKLRSQYKITVIAITHDIQEIEQSDQVIIIDGGKKKLEGKPAKILIEDEKLESFGLEVPFTRRVRKRLFELGIVLPNDYESKEMVANKIWKYYSKM
ncbi:energizing coupling factor of ABC influx transporter (ATP-binding protein) [Oenococcus oeni]|uniref:energy-coupling factor transporter ATPase n=1 Tax=Oenococcus oeni TaxID=1247 RepID=UPI001078AE7D|nr:energy-coupling factor transporter ATPase [Oenococcus oeni]AVI93990.1 energy-coupling factor transporter ATPase [Oenococcus oeni]SYV99856.1 energizing coupling factor of ABC influx transporter (ATP-binding protein) [Oenococcus oeni]SYW04176.1 energizing coupling factor of ABC influx transporter (ATP-binding protein) [Oenococcus oeni]VDC14487.1 energizing coupling factor of ABC influx transporter (ATP-binding protein) [Oenococcus oeni]